MAGMASADESAVPYAGPLPWCDGGAWPSMPGNSGATPYFDPMSRRSVVRARVLAVVINKYLLPTFY
jgi:hypothetical protein